ncbi:lytic polysaccharide monooxygenase auxiliary activity family 9 protein [Amycolatopsis aidingensis]|uniref:lytic polysaccharide monooxygenase auxiliary activity family 9 protein n=1 Tax=Amycolatopsis aidingensis TaxID=2842453 RepID=UPI001C0DD6E3|nr:lytic polysaccharide monooxygenase [Amycolatopsis aidingensis]
MRIRRTLTTVTALTSAFVLGSGLLTAGVAGAHGSMSNPVSRVYNCYLEGPESPDSAACKAAVAASGSWVFYDWNEVNQPNADGRHREIIPDGQLCSAGRSKYRGLDLPRADWKATPLPSSGEYTFQYLAAVPHPGYFELYVTRDGYDPTQPLRWSDLERFHRVDNPPLVNRRYQIRATLPEGRTGRHLIYSIWQRVRPDSGEAFYTCSDVVFGGR